MKSLVERGGVVVRFGGEIERWKRKGGGKEKERERDWS